MINTYCPPRTSGVLGKSSRCLPSLSLPPHASRSSAVTALPTSSSFCYAPGNFSSTIHFYRPFPSNKASYWAFPSSASTAILLIMTIRILFTVIFVADGSALSSPLPIVAMAGGGAPLLLAAAICTAVLLLLCRGCGGNTHRAFAAAITGASSPISYSQSYSCTPRLAAARRIASSSLALTAPSVNLGHNVCLMAPFFSLFRFLLLSLLLTVLSALPLAPMLHFGGSSLIVTVAVVSAEAALPPAPFATIGLSKAPLYGYCVPTATAVPSCKGGLATALAVYRAETDALAGKAPCLSCSSPTSENACGNSTGSNSTNDSALANTDYTSFLNVTTAVNNSNNSTNATILCNSNINQSTNNSTINNNTTTLPSSGSGACGGSGMASYTGSAAATAQQQQQRREFIAALDTNTPFVLMHPQEYGANAIALRAFGVEYFIGDTYSHRNGIGRRGEALLYTDDVKAIASNMQLAVTDEWFHYIHTAPIMFDGAVGVLAVASSWQATAVPAGPALLQGIKYLRPRVKVVVVVNNDITARGTTLLSELSSNPPDVFLDLTAGKHIPCSLVNNTQYCGVYYAGDAVNLLHIYLNSTADGLGYAAVQSEGITDLPVDDPVFDATYYAHQAFLAGEASKAIAYDPTVGTTNVGMPPTQWSSLFNPCLEKECPHATAYGRALLHYAPTANFAISNSGGFRGNGWPAGDIVMSHLFEMKPYSDPLVLVTVLGYTVYELMRLSLEEYTQSPQYDLTADRFLQGAGFQLDFNASGRRFTNRLLGVRLLNRETGLYEPLVRTQYYTLVTDNYMYSFMPDYSTILQRHYRGESAINPLGSGTIQTAIAALFTDTSPYDDLFSNFVQYYTTDTIGSRAPMEWVQRAESCSNAQYWDEGIVSCIDCGDGYARSADGTGCVLLPGETSGDVHLSRTVIAIVVPIVVVLLLALGILVAILEHRRRKNTRNTAYAPKSGDGITIVFTDIQSSTKLWGTVPASMAAALEIHHRVIRSAIAKHRGYEVKTIGDSFMIACSSADDAVLMAVSIQEGLAAEAWPIAIGIGYGHMDEAGHDMAALGPLLDSVDDLPNTFSKAGSCPASGSADGTGGNGKGSSYAADVGVRVRIGINTGVAEAVFDEVSKGYDYYGPAVNTAARIEAAAQGGQILTAKATSNLLSPHASYVVAYYTTLPLRDVDKQGVGSIELLQVCPTSLGNRFPKEVNAASTAGLGCGDADVGGVVGGGAAVALHTRYANRRSGAVHGGGGAGVGGGGRGRFSPESFASHYTVPPGTVVSPMTPSSLHATESSSLSLSCQSSSAASHGSGSPSAGRGGGGGGIGSERYAFVLRESLATALSLLDPRARGRVMGVIGASWRVQATGQMSRPSTDGSAVAAAAATAGGVATSVTGGSGFGGVPRGEVGAGVTVSLPLPPSQTASFDMLPAAAAGVVGRHPSSSASSSSSAPRPPHINNIMNHSNGSAVAMSTTDELLAKVSARACHAFRRRMEEEGVHRHHNQTHHHSTSRHHHNHHHNSNTINNTTAASPRQYPRSDAYRNGDGRGGGAVDVTVSPTTVPFTPSSFSELPFYWAGGGGSGGSGGAEEELTAMASGGGGGGADLGALTLANVQQWHHHAPFQQQQQQIGGGLTVPTFPVWPPSAVGVGDGRGFAVMGCGGGGGGGDCGGLHPSGGTAVGAAFQATDEDERSTASSFTHHNRAHPHRQHRPTLVDAIVAGMATRSMPTSPREERLATPREANPMLCSVGCGDSQQQHEQAQEQEQHSSSSHTISHRGGGGPASLSSTNAGANTSVGYHYTQTQTNPSSTLQPLHSNSCDAKGNAADYAGDDARSRRGRVLIRKMCLVGGGRGVALAGTAFSPLGLGDSVGFDDATSPTGVAVSRSGDGDGGAPSNPPSASPLPSMGAQQVCPSEGAV